MRYSILLTILMAMLTAGCYVPPGPVQTDTPWYQVDPVTGRGFFLYVPEKTYSHNKPAPLIISCHGTPPYDVAQHHVDTWKGYGEKYGCIVLAPTLDGTDGIFGDGPTNAMLVNERNLMSMISLVCYKYNIDRNNIMITGFSGGGFPAYWIGLRHPELFSCVIAQNCNFNKNNLDGWYPPEARKIPMMVFWGEHDPATIIIQSQNAVEYLRAKGFNLKTYIVPNAGHDRHPEIAMNFFRSHWRAPNGTRSTQAGSTGAASSPNTTGTDDSTPLGPRPPRL